MNLFGVGWKCARTDTVDGDAERAEFARQSPRHADERAFRRHIWQQIGPPAGQRDARHIDDPPRRLLLHRRQHGAHAYDRRLNVHALHDLQFLHAVVFDGAARIDRGIVDQNVDATFLATEFVDQPSAVAPRSARSPRTRRTEPGVATEAAAFRQQALALGSIDVERQHPRTGFDEGERNRSAQPAGTAGQQNLLVSQIDIHWHASSIRSIDGGADRRCAGV